MKSVIRLKKLEVTRDVPILTGVDWEVRKGEHWAVLGANGSGKTSLVSALAGYMTPTSGAMTVLGQTYGQTDWRNLREHIGLVSSSIQQKLEKGESALETVVSGRYAQINFWGKVTAEDRKAANKILRDVECEDLAEREWGVLSQGERQRILIGRALIGNPKLLILDEPCAGLDPAARESFLAFLKRLVRREGSPSLVLVTHHVEEILPLFTHALVIKSGRVLASGPAAQVLNSSVLSRAFGVPIEVQKSDGRYRLAIRPRSKQIL